jgi:two-component system, OmpR family, alkaline phosphatase synthesis response regulator PhoP
MSQILVVEDDPDIADLIRHYLEKSGHAVHVLGSGAAVLPKVRGERPDLIVLDLMLPGLDGLMVCQALRADPLTAAIPIIMVTARAKELAARVSALLRRTQRADPAGPVERYGSITIDSARHVVTVDDQEVRLTAKEFLLLLYLVQHRGRVLSRDLLLTDVWGYQYTGGTRTVDVHIRRLREKVPVLTDAIETIKQFGYKLVDA